MKPNKHFFSFDKSILIVMMAKDQFHAKVMILL